MEYLRLEIPYVGVPDVRNTCVWGYLILKIPNILRQRCGDYLRRLEVPKLLRNVSKRNTSDAESTRDVEKKLMLRNTIVVKKYQCVEKYQRIERLQWC